MLKNATCFVFVKLVMIDNTENILLMTLQKCRGPMQIWPTPDPTLIQAAHRNMHEMTVRAKHINFLLSTRLGYLERVQQFVERELVDINWCFVNGNCCLHECILGNQREVFDYLLGVDYMDFDYCNAYGWTPLYLACMVKNYYFVFKLILRGGMLTISTKNIFVFSFVTKIVCILADPDYVKTGSNNQSVRELSWTDPKLNIVLDEAEHWRPKRNTPVRSVQQRNSEFMARCATTATVLDKIGIDSGHPIPTPVTPMESGQDTKETENRPETEQLGINDDNDENVGVDPEEPVLSPLQLVKQRVLNNLGYEHSRRQQMIRLVRKDVPGNLGHSEDHSKSLSEDREASKSIISVTSTESGSVLRTNEMNESEKSPKLTSIREKQRGFDDLTTVSAIGDKASLPNSPISKSEKRGMQRAEAAMVRYSAMSMPMMDLGTSDDSDDSEDPKAPDPLALLKRMLSDDLNAETSSESSSEDMAKKLEAKRKEDEKKAKMSVNFLDRMASTRLSPRTRHQSMAASHLGKVLARPNAKVSDLLFV